jgi:hypothetical protein
MQVRCPQCHAPIEIDSDGKLSDIGAAAERIETQMARPGDSLSP